MKLSKLWRFSRLTALPALLLISGCSALSAINPMQATGIALGAARKNPPKELSNAELDQARAEENLSLLDAVCEGKQATSWSGGPEYACFSAKAIRAGQQVDTVSCDELIATYKVAAHTSTPAKIQRFGERMAECGEYTYLFENLAGWGERSVDGTILQGIEDKGHPLDAELTKYLKTHTGSKFFPAEGDSTMWGLGHIGEWLVKSGRTKHCKAFATAAKGASETARYSILSYFADAKCKEGIPLATEMLLSEGYLRRIEACETLAEIGDKKARQRVYSIANTDPYSELVEQRREDRIWATTVYPVRKACTEAVGKMDVRL